MLKIYPLSYLIRPVSSMIFLRIYEVLSPELSATKNRNQLLIKKIVQLERSKVNSVQYHCRESPDINPVPASIGNEAPETNLCKVLSLFGHEVKHNNF